MKNSVPRIRYRMREKNRRQKIEREELQCATLPIGRKKLGVKKKRLKLGAIDPKNIYRVDDSARKLTAS
jgi:hypothetical protein